MKAYLVEITGCANATYRDYRKGTKIISEKGVLDITPCPNHLVDPTHYIVKLVLCVPDRKFPIDNLEGKKEVECKVSIKEYERWLEKRKAVEWL